MLIRALVALAAGWVTAGVGVAILLRAVSREQMDVAAGGAVVLGVAVAALVWWSTRSWGARPITDAEMASGFDVHLSPQCKILFALLSVMTVGAMGLFLWWHLRRWPARLDPDGMTLRNGKRLAWSEIAGVQHVVAMMYGLRFIERWEVRGRSALAVIVPNMLSEGKAVLDFASRALGRELP
jgi:hypothetical protein